MPTGWCDMMSLANLIWGFMAKILVIDDEQSIRDLLEKLLRREGYEVMLAESGWEGLELFLSRTSRGRRAGS